MPLFNLEKYVVKEAKPALVMLLLDTSGSMAGEKIKILNECVKTMIEDFSKEIKINVEIKMSIITFGEKVELISFDQNSMPFHSAKGMRLNKNLVAEGLTPLGGALKMAKEIIENTEKTPKRAYRPIIVLVSDGEPNDSWDAPLTNFIKDGRSSKTQRMALAIGKEANKNMLKQFVSSTEYLFEADDVSKITDFFKFVTQSTISVTKTNKIEY